MILWELFSGFFIANILGYGGGPASIPLMQQQVVDHYGWMTNPQFVDMLAVANALPGPIATKIAAFTGYQQAGWLGLLVATIATIAPSAIAIIILLKVLNHFKQSDIVKGMTLLVQPVIAVMMIELTWDFSFVSFDSIGYWQSGLIALFALLAIVKWKVHPAIVIVLAFIYGGVVIPHLA
ncbi:chromate transporter [Neobacillus kokaensis]|uniref:Transporter YwrA n=1 Tax=Neobacillus kokaensis TaxID=2759023 RepID=A0ABQ3NAI2_9BACI|nr:chromate transporter [Neobacillus kokaensis]GHH99416.1 putative transporter YwrA [Neobacillus kokaensis]